MRLPPTLPVLALTILLSGCSFLPLVSYDREKLIAKASANNHIIEKLKPQDAIFLAAEWRRTLETSTNDRRTQELVAEEVLYYGTLVLLGAQTAIARRDPAAPISTDLHRARNAGAVSALFSTLFTSHYKTADQIPIFEKAARRMRCVTDALVDIRPEVRASFEDDAYLQLVDNKGRAISEYYNQFPKQVIEYIEQHSLVDLRAGLSSITLGQPSKDDIAAAVKNWDDAKKAASEATQKPGNQPEVAEKHVNLLRRFLNIEAVGSNATQADITELKDSQQKFQSALIQLSANLDMCTKTYQQ